MARAERRRNRNPKRVPTRPARTPRASIHGHTAIIALVLAALHLLLGALSFEPAPHNGGDNAAYLALAQSLLGGHGYREIYDPAMPLHTQYPPVFPALLAGLLAVGFQPWVPFKILVLLTSAAAIAFSYLWMRRKLQPEIALSVAILMAISPGVLYLSHWELSDVPFWAFTMAALVAWDRLGERDTKRLIVASVLTLIAYFTRSAGLPLLLGAGAWLIWRRRWKQLLIFVAILTPFVFWWWLRARTKGGVDYVQQFWFVNPYDPSLGRVSTIDLLRRAAANFTAYRARHLPILMVGLENILAQILAVLTLGLGIFGWVRRLKHAHVAELFLPLYIGLLLAWPAVWSGERFLVPALPLILFYAAEGLQRVLLFARVPRRRLIGYVVAGLIALVALPALVQSARFGLMCSRFYRMGDRYACHPDQWKDFFATAEFAGQVLPGNAVVLSRKPRTFWAFSGGLKGRIYPLREEADSLFAAAKDAGARYVVVDRVDGLSARYLMPTLMRRPNAFCILYSLGADRSAILGIKPGAETLPDRPSDQNQPQVGFELCGPEYWKSPQVMQQYVR
jgi:hypothetical protein